MQKSKAMLAISCAMATSCLLALPGCTAPVGFKTPPVPQVFAPESPATVSGGQLPAFVIRDANSAWGFFEKVSMVFLDGRVVTWTNPEADGVNGSHRQGGEDPRLGEPTIDTITMMLGDEENLETGQVGKIEDIEGVWRETLSADLDAGRTQSDLVSLDAGSRDVYVLEDDGTLHWVSASGDTECRLDDPHVEEAARVFTGSL